MRECITTSTHICIYIYIYIKWYLFALLSWPAIIFTGIYYKIRYSMRKKWVKVGALSDKQAELQKNIQKISKKILGYTSIELAK